MISNEERREVARRLRKLDHVVTNCDTIESGVNKFIKAVYGDRPYSPIECSTRNLCGLAMTLADLIDRPTCTEVEVTKEEGEYGPIIFHHELSCGHTCDTGWSKPPKYCNECGARIIEVDDGE